MMFTRENASEVALDFSVEITSEIPLNPFGFVVCVFYE